MKEIDIPTGWLRGTLDPCLLALLADGPAYGYDLRRQLADHGMGTVPGGSVYPALLRLEEQGLLAAEWRTSETGPGRKYYALTDAGWDHALDLAERWSSFSDAVAAILQKVAAR